ncbi:MAG: NADH-quinone oxidoreductase subunit J [Dehalococcoidia bacterium]
MSLILFYFLGAATLMAAVGVVTTRNIVYAALFLLGALTGVAGLFVLLFAEFLALVQLLIYGGAIIIVILFGLMLTRSGEYEAVGEHRRWPFAAAASVGLFAVLAVAAVGDSDLFNSDARVGVDLTTLGTTLFEDWAVPFEIASLVLLVALIGAVVIGRAGGPDDPGDVTVPPLPAEESTPPPRRAPAQTRRPRTPARRTRRARP